MKQRNMDWRSLWWIPVICAGAILVAMIATTTIEAFDESEFVGYEVDDPTADETPLDVQAEESSISDAQNAISFDQFDRFPQDSIVDDPDELQLRDEGDDELPELEADPLVPAPIDPTTMYQQITAELPAENVTIQGGEELADDW